jgi:peptide-methionine (S)-S-oxide reductase
MRNIIMKSALALGAGVAIAALFLSSPGGAEKAVAIPAPALDQPRAPGAQVAVLAGGCFWGMEGVFEHVKGVKAVTSGYAGGSAADATYDQVSNETTRHAEAIRIVYNPAEVSYGTLLRVYFSVAHNPTELNRQGPDTGTSYRSAIFPQSPEQSKIAATYISQLSKARAFSGPIVTRLEAGKFFPAEAYHQDFLRRNPSHPYIQHWDMPKLAAYKAAFPQLWKA